jgi:hypothetical protein
MKQILQMRNCPSLYDVVPVSCCCSWLSKKGDSAWIECSQVKGHGSGQTPNIVHVEKKCILNLIIFCLNVSVSLL